MNNPIHLSLRNPPQQSPRARTGIEGLDNILGGGLPSNQLHLIEGTPGSGKTTLGMQFLLEGLASGEKVLYITLSESASELHVIAASHGWSLEGVHLFQLISDDGLKPDAEQSILHPAEIELGETSRGLMRVIQEQKPTRVVFDSLSEMRMLAQNSLRYRRQILALKHFFATCKCTVLLLDDKTSEAGDLQLHSIVHGVITLEQHLQEYGIERRRLRVLKMRGVKFAGGAHDLRLDTGGISVFARPVGNEHLGAAVSVQLTSGCPALDALLGGGLSSGTNTMFTGPSGIGKTTTAVSCVNAALRRGEKAAYFLFDESLATLLSRSAALDMDLRPAINSGQIKIHPIDPAELSPGEFAHLVRQATIADGASVVVIDSLNGYLQAMPGRQFLLLQMHELLAFLNIQGATTILILGEHGLIGEVRTDVDLSYLSDAIVAFKFFEARGELRKAVSVVKSRTADHELAIREFRLGPGGLEVGLALQDFEGVLSGLPSYRGSTPLLGGNNAAKVA